MSRQDHEDLKSRAPKTAGTPKTSANDRQVGGSHYQTSGLQHWDMFGVEYLMGYATKYMRWRKKGGVQDLEKAVHVCEKLRELVSAGAQRPALTIRHVVESWCKDYGLDWVESAIVMRLMFWDNKSDIDEAIGGIKYLIETERGKAKIVDTLRSDPAILNGLTMPMVGKDKPYVEMTDEELSNALTRLTEDQGKAKSWGAAVGVRAEYIKEIQSEQARRERRVPRWRPVADDGSGLSTASGGGHGGYNAKKSPGPLGHVLGDTETPFIQRTPEDGAQHANVAPWVVTEPWLGAAEIGTDLITAFWTRRIANLHVLEPCVNTPNIPRVLRACYNLKAGVGWVLDIRKCPPDAREYFPNLLREQNMKEWEDLPEWERGLYEWDEQGNKYSLGQFTEAWHVEAT